MTDPIRDWFKRQDETDSDYFLACRASPFHVALPLPGCDLVVYTHKQHLLLPLYHECEPAPEFGVVSRVGLPSEADVDWIRNAFDGRRFAFVGDCDPVDLLIYAYLAERLPMQWIGVSDRLLQACCVPMEPHLTIKMPENEVAGLGLARDCLGDLPALVGPWCAGLLDAGHKIEAEVLRGSATISRNEFAVTIAEWGGVPE